MFTTVAHVSIDRAPGRGAGLEGQSLPGPRVQRDVDALPVVGAGRAVVGFERHVIVRAPSRRRGCVSVYTSTG